MFDFNNYFEAASISEAVDYLSSNKNSIVISGGTDVLIKLRDRDHKFLEKDMVGISRISELKKIYLDDEGSLIIGATCSFSSIDTNELIIKHAKSLGKAAGSVGGPQIRNMGTIGGNVANGATSADTAATLFTYNAIIVIENKAGEKEIPIDKFYISAGKVSLDHGDLVKWIKIKKEDYSGYKGDYIKFSQREAMDIATLGCAVLIKEKNNVIEDLRLAYGVAAPTPVRATAAENYAKGKTITDEVLTEIGKKALEDTKARNSWRGSKDFREQLITKLPKRAIITALKEG